MSTITDRCNPDSKVVRRAQGGDVNAFASIFEEHKGKIYSVCLRMTNNAAEAEDLTQDAFIQVFRKLGTLNAPSTATRAGRSGWTQGSTAKEQGFTWNLSISCP